MAKKLWIENVSSPDCIRYQENEPTSVDGFSDFTNDLEKWDQYGDLARLENGRFLQYKQKREIIIGLVLSIVNPDFSGWTAASQETKEIAAKHIVAPYSLRMAVVGDDAVDYKNFAHLVTQTSGISRENLIGRQRVVEEMRFFVALNYYRKEILQKADSDDFMMSTMPHINSYLGTNAPDLKFWITNVIGSPFENDGFAQKSYFSTTLMAELMSIYYGNF